MNCDAYLELLISYREYLFLPGYELVLTPRLAGNLRSPNAGMIQQGVSSGVVLSRYPLSCEEVVGDGLQVTGGFVIACG